MNIGSNLKRARLINDLSLKKASKLLKISISKLIKYEKGLLIPDSTELINFANVYHVKTYELLKIYTLPELDFYKFRKKEKLKGKNLELLKEISEIEIAKYMEILDNNPNYLKKYVCNTCLDAEEVADKFREEVLSLNKEEPFLNIIKRLEDLGIMVVSIDNLNHKFDEFDGLSTIINNIPIIIILKDAKNGERQRFTLVHELGHLVLGVRSESEEKIAHRFASALLMPKESVIKMFGQYSSKIDFGKLKSYREKYKVSYEAILYRLKDLNIISDDYYRTLNIIPNKYIKKQDTNLLKPEQTCQFEDSINNLIRKSKISENKAKELLGDSKNEYNADDYNYGY